MIGRVAVLTLVVWCARAHADGLVIAGGSPHAIGRAGVGTVGDDGGGALLVNPAALARRSATRVQIGVAFVDDSVDWARSDVTPKAADQAGSTALPLVALEAGVGDWVIGVGAMTSAGSDRALRRPGRNPPETFANTFDYRYAGLTGGMRRDTVTIGAARRLGDAVAIGLAVAGSRASIAETRRLWASAVAGRVVGDPNYDVELAMTAADRLSPSAVAGVLVAPPDTRVELGASIAWASTVHATGDLAASGPAAGAQTPGVIVTTASPSATIDLQQPITLHTGARWLGERWIGEVGGDLWVFPATAEAATWQVSGVNLVDATNRRSIDLAAVPSRVSRRTSGALRGAVDVELIDGLLWVTAGYAFTTAGTLRSRMSPTFGELGGHTLGLGLEATAGGFTITLGWARTWSIKQPEVVSRWRLDNPFGIGDADVPGGIYDGSRDLIGISIDAELDAPTP